MLTNADLTRILRYRAYRLDGSADPVAAVLAQIDRINTLDSTHGTTIAAAIQADLAQLEAEDAAIADNSANANLEQVDVIRYYPGGAVAGHLAELERLRRRIADTLAQVPPEPPASLLGRS